MKDPCKKCVVQPMCRTGCDNIWNYRNYLKNEYSKRNKLAGRLIMASIVQALLWGILLFTDVIQYRGSWNFLYDGKEFSTLWHWIPYLIILGTAVTLQATYVRIRKKRTRIERGSRSEFIWRKEMEEQQKIKSHKGGDVII